MRREVKGKNKIGRECKYKATAWNFLLYFMTYSHAYMTFTSSWLEEARYFITKMHYARVTIQVVISSLCWPEFQDK